jgi:hypothetical protein
VVPAGGNLYGIVDAFHLDGQWIVPGTSVPELALSTFTPAFDSTVMANCTRMLRASCDIAHSIELTHLNR